MLGKIASALMAIGSVLFVIVTILDYSRTGDVAIQYPALALVTAAASALFYQLNTSRREIHNS